MFIAVVLIAHQARPEDIFPKLSPLLDSLILILFKVSDYSHQCNHYSTLKNVLSIEDIKVCIVTIV